MKTSGAIKLEWPSAVRDALDRHPDAEVVAKDFPRGFPHEHPFVAVAGLVRDPSGRVLLVKHRPGTPWRDAWATPGGIVMEGENPEEALRREILEECGLEVTGMTLARLVVMDDRSGLEAKTSFTMIFETQLKVTVQPRPRGTDVVREARWFSRLPPDMAFRDEYSDLV